MFRITMEDRLELRITRLRRALVAVASGGCPSGVKRVIHNALREDGLAHKQLSAEDAELIGKKKYREVGEAIIDRESAAPVAEVIEAEYDNMFRPKVKMIWTGTYIPTPGMKLHAEQPAQAYTVTPSPVTPKPAFWRCIRYPTGKNIPLEFMSVDVYDESSLRRYEQFGCVMEPYYRGAPNPALDTMDTERVNQFVYCLDNLSRMLVSLSSDMRAGRKPKKIDFPIDE